MVAVPTAGAVLRQAIRNGDRACQPGQRATQVGVLALQGGFAEHRSALRRCGLDSLEVRTPDELHTVDALVIPGGESTTMLKLIDRFGLREPLVRRIEQGLPVLGTCAGAIVLATETSDGEPPLGLLDLTVRRNAYGRQRESFEEWIEVREMGAIPAVFIRAPLFERVGRKVEVLATWGDHPVLVRQGRLVASAFHPELTDDLRLHGYFAREVWGAGEASAGGA